MKFKNFASGFAGLSILITRIYAQDSDLDLQTKSTGQAPAHETPTSAAQWMQNPLAQQMVICVSNLYANASDYLEIDIGGERRLFYGAGTDGLGNYIPTNYPSVTVDATLRRQYGMTISCPNSGPSGSPFFQVGELDPNNFLPVLTNSVTGLVSAFLWANLPPTNQFWLTNSSTTYDIQKTNLVIGINQILTGASIYTSNRFAGITLGSDTTNLLAENPAGQMLVELNHLLLRDAYPTFGISDGNADYSGTAIISLSISAPPQLHISKILPAPSYTITINNDSSSGGVLNLYKPATGYESVTNITVEVLKDKFSHYGVGDGCDDASKAPGQGTWLTMGPGCTQDTNRISLAWSVSLGRTFDGLAAGQLAFREPSLTGNSYTPYALYYNAAYTNLYENVPLVPYSVVTNGDGTLTTNSFVQQNLTGSVFLITTNVATLETNSEGGTYFNNETLLRQVMAYQTFVDILAPDTNHTILKFYQASQVGTNRDVTGLYTNIPPNAFVTWTIANPSPGSTNNLLIIENRLDGGGVTNSLAKTVSGGGVTWTLTQGAGTTTRTETRVVSFAGSPASDRFESDTIAYSGGAPAYQCQEQYHFFPWGAELTQTVIPNGTANLTNTYSYYTNINGSLPDDPYGFGYSQPNIITYPDGYWEKRVYGELEDDPNSENDGYYYGEPVEYAFHPCLDGSASGVTSPAGAPSFDTAYDKYLFETSPSQTLVYTFDGAPYAESLLKSHGTLTDYFDEPEGLVDVSESQAVEHGSISDDPDYFDDTHQYDPSAPTGLADHLMYEYSYASIYEANLFYFDFGVFDPVANAFNLNTNGLLYGSITITNNYPDHRETKIIGCRNSAFFGAPDFYSSMEGHDLEDGETDYSSSFFFSIAPFQSIKTTRIYHGGNLVLTEKYVYTGNSAGETGGISDAEPEWSLIRKIRYYNDSLGRATNAVLIDGVTGVARPVYNANYQGANGLDGELLLSETDENGTTTRYAYDSLQRVSNITHVGFGLQVNQSTAITYDANNHTLRQVTQAGGLGLTNSSAYDLAGRLTNEIDPSGIATGISYSANNQVVTTNFPGGNYSTATYYPDRRMTSVAGNATVPQYYTYEDYTPQEYSTAYWLYFSWQKTITTLGHAGSPRWHATGRNGYGTLVWDENPNGSTTTNTSWKLYGYEGNSITWEQASPGAPSVVYNYGCNAEPNITGTWENAPSYLFDAEHPWPMSTDDPGSRCSQADIFYWNNGIVWYQVTTNYAFLTDDSSAQSMMSIHQEQLNGFSDTRTKAYSIDYDADTNQTITTTYVDRANNLITTNISEPATSSLIATQVFQNGMLVTNSTLSVASPTLYFYDALGRTNRIQSPLGYSATINYDPTTGWITSQTDFTGQTTSYQYYGVTQTNAGKLFCQTSATGKKTYYIYTTQGKLAQTWGDVPYPAQYKYNEYGDLTNLTTFRGGSGWTGSAWPSSPVAGDNTYWIYDPASGALLQKIDAQTNTVNYAYDPVTGRLLTRSWARMIGGNNVMVTNSYNGFGDLIEQDYNDGTASVYYNNYNRAAQPREMVDATGTNELTYDYASRLVAIYCTNGLLAGITVSNHFNPAWGRDAVAVLGLSTPLADNYGYDPNSGRLASVTSGACVAQYAYAPNSDLLASTTFKNGASTVLTTTRTWDYGTRLHSIANLVNGSPVTSHSYAYDALNRRTAAQLEDGSTWQYGYDDRDELTTASRNWAQWLYDAPVAGQQFNYAYDNIGNRLTAASGGDTNGLNLRTNYYAANSLNQYSGIVTPGYQSIIGAALATNSVTVNGGVADRKAEYFHRELTVANGSGPVWQNVTNISGTFTNRGGLVVPAASQSLVYDADGNLTSDGIWTYQWDGENRLVSMEMSPSVSGLASSNCFRLDFTYDYMGRRIQKIVSVWNVAANNFVPATTNLFVYDGCNLLVVINPGYLIRQSFTWGNDLSGTMVLDGGIGGLLIVNYSNNTCFAECDGIGNIEGLINATNGSIEASYEYSPYGELIRETGPCASLNPIKFSTKYCDFESGFLFFGCRFYSPSNGRWLSQDPSAEEGGLNLNAFVANHPVNSVDDNGLAEHHVATLKLARSLPDGPGSDYLKQFTITVSDPHYYDTAHRVYSQAISDFFDTWCSKRNITPQQFANSEQLAKQFVADIMKKPKNSSIRGYLDANGAAYWGGKAAKAAVILGVAFSGATTAYNVYAASPDLVSAANDYKRDVSSGADSAWADLDAVDAAVATQTMTGDYFVTMDVLGTLLTP